MMTIFDPAGELADVVEGIGEIRHAVSISGLLNAVYHKVSSLSRSEDVSSEDQDRLRQISFQLKPIIDEHEPLLGVLEEKTD